MIQEILTYIILGWAFFFVIIKIKNIFWRKKELKYSSNTDDKLMQNSCSGCAANCTSRNLSTPNIQNNSELFRKIEI